MKKKNPLIIFLLVAAIVVVVDQLMKLLITKQIIPLKFTTNTGAGFSILQGWNIVLIWIGIAVIGTILLYYFKIAEEKPIANISSALVLGGTIGNLIDRISLGHVIDFIDLKIWPSFNIADSAITIGALLLIYYLIKEKK
jgi:signal peptidase II